ncbi:hypothetical protein CL652_00415 [bacterium]|nr:hypothetical protein [bacterium]|tara:strand:- start:3696 stop:3914 length:219 start_codon:yes stop_codon:yes gene_type:complete
MDMLGGNILLLMTLSTLWTLPWKGWALWLAARRGERVWFIVLLVVNTLAVLEIIYIFGVAKRRDTDDLTSEQ